MGRAARFGALLLAANAASACFPLPWITPPVSAAFGPELRGTLDERSDAPPDETVDTVGASYRFGFHPLQLVPSMTERPVDVAVGWQLLTGDPLAASNGGPYLEGIWFFHQRDVTYEHLSSDVVRFRLGVGTQLRIHDIDAFRLGAALQLNAEWASFVSGAAGECEDGRRASACYLGAGFGEAAAGFFVNVGFADYGSRRMLTATGGIIVRLPASAGAALFIFL